MAELLELGSKSTPEDAIDRTRSSDVLLRVPSGAPESSTSSADMFLDNGQSRKSFRFAQFW
jgi:hypothetical protein